MTAARKPWTKRKDAPARLSGRAGVERRARWLYAHPLCLHCMEGTPSRVSAGVIVDHVLPLSRGGADDESNLQTLCRACDRIKTAADLGQKLVYGCDESGFSLDPNSAWCKR